MDGHSGHGDYGHGDNGHGDHGHGDNGHGDHGHGDNGHGDHGHNEGAQEFQGEHEHHSGHDHPSGHEVLDDIKDFNAHHFGHHDLPIEGHYSHGMNAGYFDDHPGTYLSDEVTGIAYYHDGYFHSGSFDFLDSYIYGGASYGGFHSLGNNSYLLALMLTSSYSHGGLGLYPFGYVLFPLAAQLYRNSQTAVTGKTASTSTSASGQAFSSNPQDVYEALAKNEKAASREYFGAHVAHGFIDVHDAFKSLALRYGLSRVRINDNCAQIEPVISDKSISDWNRFVPPYTREETPKGYYPGATGLTYFTQQCWSAAAPCPNAWLRFLQALGGTTISQIKVRIVTWYFDRVDDYETRLDMKVTRGRGFADNQEAASKLCEEMFAILKSVKPSSFAQAKRCKIFAGDYLF